MIEFCAVDNRESVLEKQHLRGPCDFAPQSQKKNYSLMSAMLQICRAGMVDSAGEKDIKPS